MGRTLDALLGRNFKTSKFKTLLKLAISRSSILSNQHHTRLSHARSDVKELLMIGQQDRAMLRVEHVVKEQNMVDVFSMVDFYCHLLFERAKLLAQDKECHEELREAISSLIYAASRCGEFPELQKIREILISKFGKEFAARAVELRNNCGVSPKIVQKFSIRRPSFECRAKFLKEIGSECGLTLQLEEDAPLSYSKSLQKERQEVIQTQEEEIKPSAKATESDENALARKISLFKDIKELEEFTESMKARRKYTGAAAAAQDAFESAAHAAVAARAAVELSMNEFMGRNQDDDDDRLDFDDVTSKTKALMIISSVETEGCVDNSPSFEKVNLAEDVGSEAETKIETEDDVTSKTKALMIISSVETEGCVDNSPSFEEVNPVEDAGSEAETKIETKDDSCDIRPLEEEEKEKELGREVPNSSRDGSLMDESLELSFESYART